VPTFGNKSNFSYISIKPQKHPKQARQNAVIQMKQEENSNFSATQERQELPAQQSEGANVPVSGDPM
jgi:hypothetical protein